MQCDNYSKGPLWAVASSNTSQSRPNKFVLQHLELYDVLREKKKINKERKDIFPNRKEITKISGSPQGPWGMAGAGARVLKHTLAQTKTENLTIAGVCP